jgi:transposase
VEGCTGWRFIAEELARAGVQVHLAEPADTATARGRKKRVKTDRADARLIRELLAEGRLPESWVPPWQVLEIRTLGRLYCALMDQRRAWQQRIHAQLYHQGAPAVRGLLSEAGGVALAAAELSPAGRQSVDTALVAVDALTDQIDPLRRQLIGFARRQPGCRALQAHYGIGWLCAAIIWAELRDCRRFTSSDQAVRFAGLDITVYSSDGKRSPGRLARQGSPELRWALYEAAKSASRHTSPDYRYYTAVTGQLGGKRPALSVARKLPRRAHHTLRGLGDAAFAPQRAGGGRLMRLRRALPTVQLMPAACTRHAPDTAHPRVDVPERTSGRVPSLGTTPHRPSRRRTPDRVPRTQIKASHRRAPSAYPTTVHRRQTMT